MLILSKKSLLQVLGFLVLIGSFTINSVIATTSQKSYASYKESKVYSIHGFSVDSHDNIYYHTGAKVIVYSSSGEFLYSIKPKTYGTFEIDIDEQDRLNIALCREGVIEVFDKEGYVIKEIEDKENILFNQFKKKNHHKVDTNGNEYILSNYWGYTKIIKKSPSGVDTVIFSYRIG